MSKVGAGPRIYDTLQHQHTRASAKHTIWPLHRKCRVRAALSTVAEPKFSLFTDWGSIGGIMQRGLDPDLVQEDRERYCELMIACCQGNLCTLEEVAPICIRFRRS